MESIQDFLKTIARMQGSDYLDILVVAVLIYKLLPLIRTPSIMRIARTVLALVLITWITAEMELYTLNWILSQFLSIGLLAFVILFQPELRRMLDHLGSVRIRNFFGTSRQMGEVDALIGQTVMACETMSREKVGVLLVFARDQRLDEYFKTGTQIDGMVSEQLLRNIFVNKSPLHDGAVIIRDGRIAAAGCVLPVSDNPHISADLGTRHRAALGISEVSDAIAVVVSEETGTISVTENGMLKRYLAPQTLEKLLKNGLDPQNEETVQKSAMQFLKKLTGKRKEADRNEKK